MKKISWPQTVPAPQTFQVATATVMTLDDENKVVLRKVTFTWSDGTNVGVSNGLDQGERVIVGGQIALVQGDEIEPLE